MTVWGVDSRETGGQRSGIGKSSDSRSVKKNLCIKTHYGSFNRNPDLNSKGATPKQREMWSLGKLTFC